MNSKLWITTKYNRIKLFNKLIKKKKNMNRKILITPILNYLLKKM